MRECNGCTACCEGWLVGDAHGHYFQSGRPCHFKCESGCAIYENRPDDPCKNYKCEWLDNLEIPEWLKPNISKVIITKRKWSGGNYLEVLECGQKMDSIVLNWLFHYHYTTTIPIKVQISGGWTNYGSKEFLDFIIKEKSTKGR
jgi:hypothetical protein